MAKLHNDLSEFIALLNSHSVEYIIVGGHAVAFHGHPRFTGDIDFFIRPTRENADRILRVLVDFGFANLGVEAGDLVAPERVLQLGRPPNRIDILTSISGITFDSAWATRVSGQLGDRPVHFLGFDALIQNKVASDRDKDRLDVKKLKSIASRKKGA